LAHIKVAGGTQVANQRHEAHLRETLAVHSRSLAR